jgi:two-component system, OmpR family, sensor histidine kinase TctE
MKMADNSLRVSLLVRFGLGVAALLVLDALACYYTALYFTNLVYDRWLIDSTRSLTTAIRPQDGRVAVALRPDALDVFRFDEIDKTYFKIASKNRGYIVGDKELTDLIAIPNGEPRLAYSKISGRQAREVTIQIRYQDIDDVVTVSVAETLFKRAKLTQEILLAMAAPQVGLLIAAVILSWLSIARGLKPLTDLAAELEARDHDNLSPVPLTDLPHEARVLVLRMNDLLKRISSALQAQKRFITDAAHQLRTPLAVILLHAERAERATDATAEKKALAELHVSVRRAARLSQQLLTLARSEPNAIAMEAFSSVNLTAVARQIGEEWVSIALERQIDFGLSVPDQLAIVRGNEQLLGELLSNLIDNALQYVPANGSVTVRVELRDGVVLSVEDNGPGIPEAERARIFERFYRVPGTAPEGCGLGLSIVKEIADAHDIEIMASSGHDGKGITFSVRFPNVAKGRI